MPTQARFLSTQWSLVLAAGGSSSVAGHEALEELCRAYWPPLYAFARRAGHSPADARDLTQGFFAHLLDGASLSSASPERGRFRSFLLGAFKHFLAHERDRQNALKRGGGLQWVPLDLSVEEAALAGQSETGDRPDSAYDRRWAAALLERVLIRLREEFALSGRAELFNHFKDFLLGETVGGGYAAVATHLGMTEGAAKMTVTRMRDRYRRLLRAEIAHTVDHPDLVEEELRHLRAIVRGDG